MKAVVLVEPVYYIVHDGIKINAGYFKHFLESMMPEDDTVFDTNDPEEAAILDIIRAERDIMMTEEPDRSCPYYEHHFDGAIQLEWSRFRQDDLISRLVDKIEKAVEEAKKGENND